MKKFAVLNESNVVENIVVSESAEALETQFPDKTFVEYTFPDLGSVYVDGKFVKE